MSPFHQLGFGVATTLAMLLGFLGAQRLFSPGDSFRGGAGGNPARALLQVGNVLGLFLVAASVVAGCVQGQSIRQDATWVALYGCVALCVFIAFGKLGTLVLMRSRLPAELERGNVAAGLAAGAHAVATGIVVARSFVGTDLRGLGIAAIFFLLAEVSFYVLVTLFRLLTSYDDEGEIIAGNLAAALSYAGCAIAVALLVGHAVEGQFLGWARSLKGYALALVAGLFFYPVRQLVVEGLFLGARPSLYGGRLDEAVGRDRNVGIAALEATAYLSTALAIGRIAG